MSYEQARTGEIRQVTLEDVKDNLHVRNNINHYMLVQPIESEEEATELVLKNSQIYTGLVDQGDIGIIAGKIIRQIESGAIDVTPWLSRKMTADYEEKSREIIEKLTNAEVSEIVKLYGLPSDTAYNDLLGVLNIFPVIMEVHDRVDDYLREKEE